MGLRKDFLVHRKNTIESFGLVRRDIDNLNFKLDNANNIVSTLEMKMPEVVNEISNLHNKIDDINKSIMSHDKNI